MAMRVIIGFIFALTFSLSLWADTVKLNPSHPMRHVVIKGDTLWDISAKFLQDPWQWPNIWHYNSQIKNPHLIYPGDVITLCFIEGNPKLCVNNSGNRDNQPILYPHMRSTNEDKAIPMIPIEVIMPFLLSPKVVDKNELANAPYIVAFSGEHLISGAGTSVFVRAILKPNFLAYTVYRPGKTYIAPDTGEILGYEAKHIADSIILQLGDPATLRITNAKSEVRRGDRVMPASKEAEIFNLFPSPPKESIKGSIISVMGGVHDIGQYAIIVIDKGTQDGLKKGHLLTIIQKGKIIPDPFNKNKNELVQLPQQESGMVLIFRTFKRVSYGLVMTAHRDIHVLDSVQTPEQ